ncbi:hypothetical protein M2451_002651 [Dysgonomonas sp. PFB1-18]|uniref:hypothetical protein n=1 Tax=unclassified Dysgonomonas TaxID=2630389 RepID=UPI0024741E3B|nr:MULTISPECIES: hypothetical protein [unclassified Dysgonomonas]MDH6308132.1 hypothetical protein [Dysgonomonas sp. PF1-14]MDH6339671.1 hypothetical protein [Dysgonomonas sp. PF1-16]MDH6381322.1 hypothetical protein [Dysgonomonas sp. PFB1-18]MDH6398534.1 hypothetical protein [Dysgonomonas sp. PF1-23]
MGLLIGVGNTTPQFPYNSLWYGIKINLKNTGKSTDDGKLERVGNLDLHRSLPVHSRIKRFVAKEDGTVNYWLGANDSTLKEGGGAAKLNAVDGNVMLYKPDYWRRIEFDGDYMLVAVSEVELPGFTYMKESARSPWLATLDRVNNKAVSASFLQWNTDGSIKRDGTTGLPALTDNAADFRGGNNTAGNDNTVKTQLGMPATSITKATARTRCKAINAKWHLGGYRFREEMSWLMAIEFGTLDSQAAYNAAKTADGYAQGGLGNGTYVVSGEWSAFNGYYPFIPCGVTAKLGNNTGIVDYVIKGWTTGVDKTVKVASYRGWEAPQQYLWDLNDDVIIWHGKPSDGNTSLFYVCEDSSKFVTPADTSTDIPDGYKEVGALPRASGYIVSMASGNGWTCPDSVTGGASNKNYCDYYWYPAVSDTANWGWFCLLAGVSATSAEDAGVRGAYAGTRGSTSDTHGGFPLCLDL